MDSIVKGEYSLELFKKDLSRYIDSINRRCDDKDSVPVRLSVKLTPSFLKYIEKINTKERSLKIENLYYADS